MVGGGRRGGRRSPIVGAPLLLTPRRRLRGNRSASDVRLLRLLRPRRHTRPHTRPCAVASGGALLLSSIVLLELVLLSPAILRLSAVLLGMPRTGGTTSGPRLLRRELLRRGGVGTSSTSTSSRLPSTRPRREARSTDIELLLTGTALLTAGVRVRMLHGLVSHHESKPWDS